MNVTAGHGRKATTLTIAAGAQITLVNAGTSLHNFSVEGQSIDKDVQPGETETEDLELPAGTYTMFCKYHRFPSGWRARSRSAVSGRRQTGTSSPEAATKARSAALASFRRAEAK
jgi:hypothetical protein